MYENQLTSSKKGPWCFAQVVCQFGELRSWWGERKEGESVAFATKSWLYWGCGRSDRHDYIKMRLLARSLSPLSLPSVRVTRDAGNTSVFKGFAWIDDCVCTMEPPTHAANHSPPHQSPPHNFKPLKSLPNFCTHVNNALHRFLANYDN